MTRSPRLLSVGALLGLVLVTSTASWAENWPHWRGPRRDGTSTETGLATRWSQTENVRWRLDLPGAGAATPIVWGDRIFLTSAAGDDLVLLAVDRSGKVAWRKTVGRGNFEVLDGEGNAAAPSPATDGEHVWVFLSTGTLASFDFAGREVWRSDLQERYKPFKLYFVMASSPLVDGDRLYLQLLHTDQQLVLALDKATGREIWRHERATDARDECLHSYASPVLYRFADLELLLIHGADYLTAHRLADGAELWRLGGFHREGGYNPNLRFVASPVATPGLIVAPSAKNGPVVGLNPEGASGDLTGSPKQTVWRLANGTPDVPSPVVHDGLVYLSRENGMLTAVDAKSGEILYSEMVHRRPHRGSPVYADGKVFLMGGDGTVSVVRAGRKHEVLARNSVGERLASSLAVSGEVLYLRSYEALYAIGR
ncbi:MAG: PQQ-binding-like beta-propeller repeat protein [bacterium]|nr:PQQ-binding-like beta-propeller repeat protein [bacterium]